MGLVHCHRHAHATGCRAALASVLALTIVVATAANGGTVVFSSDFNSGAPAQFSGVTNTESVQGYAGLGTGTDFFSGNLLRNNGGTTDHAILTLTGLPSHTSVDLNFLLAIIDTWDGVGSSVTTQPDYFNVMVDGQLILSEAFDTQGLGAGQTYAPPPGVLLFPQMDRGFNFFNTTDDGYNMGLDPRFHNIAHIANTLKIEWFASGSGQEGTFNESWALDNVEVILNDVAAAVPEPASVALLGIGSVALIVYGAARTGRRFQSTASTSF